MMGGNAPEGSGYGRYNRGLSPEFFSWGLRIITNSLSGDGRVPERFSNTGSPEFMYRGLLLLLLARCKQSFITLHTHTHTHTHTHHIYVYIYEGVLISP